MRLYDLARLLLDNPAAAARVVVEVLVELSCGASDRPDPLLICARTHLAELVWRCQDLREDAAGGPGTRGAVHALGVDQRAMLALVLFGSHSSDRAARTVGTLTQAVADQLAAAAGAVCGPVQVGDASVRSAGQPRRVAGLP